MHLEYIPTLFEEGRVITLEDLAAKFLEPRKLEGFTDCPCGEHEH